MFNSTCGRILFTLLSFIVGAALSLSMSANGTLTKKVAVTGSTGQVGRQTVELLSSRGIPVRALVRRPSDQVAKDLASLPGVEIVEGDVTKPESMKELLAGCTAVLAVHGAGPTKPPVKSLIPFLNDENSPSHPRQVNYQSVTNLLDAARESGTCRRIVRITGKGEDPFGIFSILINMLGSMAKAWNYEGERVLRAQNDIEYTIVRPGVMGSSDPTNGGTAKVIALADDGGDLKVSAVSRRQIAELCVDCLDYPNAGRATLTAMNVPEGEGESSYGPLLERVREDRRVFPDDMLEQHKKAARLGAAVLVGFLSVVATSAIKLAELISKVVIGKLVH